MDETLLGKCGFYCGSCPTYIQGSCAGCTDEHGLGDCYTRDCVLKQGITACGMCRDFPCNIILEKERCTVLDKGWLRWKRRQQTE